MFTEAGEISNSTLLTLHEALRIDRTADDRTRIVPLITVVDVACCMEGAGFAQNISFHSPGSLRLSDCLDNVFSDVLLKRTLLWLLWPLLVSVSLRKIL